MYGLCKDCRWFRRYTNCVTGEPCGDVGNCCRIKTNEKPVPTMDTSFCIEFSRKDVAEACGKCRHYDVGECVLRPPVTGVSQPSVAKDDRCGEFKGR